MKSSKILKSVLLISALFSATSAFGGDKAKSELPFIDAFTPGGQPVLTDKKVQYILEDQAGYFDLNHKRWSERALECIVREKIPAIQDPAARHALMAALDTLEIRPPHNIDMETGPGVIWYGKRLLVQFYFVDEDEYKKHESEYFRKHILTDAPTRNYSDSKRKTFRDYYAHNDFCHIGTMKLVDRAITEKLVELGFLRVPAAPTAPVVVVPARGSKAEVQQINSDLLRAAPVINPPAKVPAKSRVSQNVDRPIEYDPTMPPLPGPVPLSATSAGAN